MEGVTTKDSPYIRMCPRCGINLTIECMTCPCCGMDLRDVHMYPASQQGLILLMEEGRQLLAEDRFAGREGMQAGGIEGPAGIPEAGEAAETDAPKERFCYNCGAKLHPGAKFCSACGAKLD